MFMLFEFMFPIIFVMVFGMIIFQFVTGIETYRITATQMEVIHLVRMGIIRPRVPVTM